MPVGRSRRRGLGSFVFEDDEVVGFLDYRPCQGPHARRAAEHHVTLATLLAHPTTVFTAAQRCRRQAEALCAGTSSHDHVVTSRSPTSTCTSSRGPRARAARLLWPRTSTRRHRMMTYAKTLARLLPGVSWGRLRGDGVDWPVAGTGAYSSRLCRPTEARPSHFATPPTRPGPSSRWSRAAALPPIIRHGIRTGGGGGGGGVRGSARKTEQRLRPRRRTGSPRDLTGRRVDPVLTVLDLAAWSVSASGPVALQPTSPAASRQRV